MKVKYKRITILFLSAFLLGCGTEVCVGDYTTMENTEGKEDSLADSKEELVDDNVVPECVNSINENINISKDNSTDIYSDEACYEYAKKSMQKLVNSAYIGINLAVETNGGYYGEMEFEECRNYEKNMILDLCNVQKWSRPAFSYDEYVQEEEEHDAPLGKYEYEDTYGDYQINHYYGGHDLGQENILHIVSLIEKVINNKTVAIRMYFMEKGAAGLMTPETQRDYSILSSFKEYCVNNVFEKYFDDADTWYWFDEDGLTFICDMNRVEKKTDEGEYDGYIYEYSVLVKCVNSNGQYVVDEVIPLKMQ